MSIQTIIGFINTIKKNPGIPEFDENFKSKIISRFTTLCDVETLSSEDIQWLKDIFAQRWEHIKDTKYDYTRDPTKEITRTWIQLAIDLEQLNAIQILIPTTIPQPFRIKLDREDFGLSFLLINDEQSTYIITLDLFKQIKDNQANLERFPQVSPEKALSITELARIRSKEGNLRFRDGEKYYNNFWDYLQQNVFPIWNKSSQLPHHLIPPLLELIDIYFSEKHKQVEAGTFRNNVLIWSKYLKNCPVNSVNSLYGVSFNIGENTKFLVEILLDFLDRSHLSLEHKVIALANWLYQYDASFIVNKEELSHLYCNFNMNFLQNFLEEVGTEEPVVKNLMLRLLYSIGNKKDIDVKIIQDLESIYKQRWLTIRNTDQDYRRLKNSTNEKWVHLAQLLSRSYLETNYLSFLMPDKEFVSLNKLLNLENIKPSLYFTFNNKTFDVFNHYYGYTIVSAWQNHAEVPRPLLTSLLELIEFFMMNTKSHNDLNLFHSYLDEWCSELNNYSFDDRQKLFMLSTTIVDSKIYFLDILLACLSENDYLLVHNNIKHFARLLCDYDASLIIDSQGLFDLYTELKVGPGFTLNDLHDHLALFNNNSNVIQNNLYHLVNRLKQLIFSDNINPGLSLKEIPIELKQLLYKIFELRWYEIQGSSNDYTRLMHGINLKWIRLAQLLSGAGLVDNTYYHLLMPTIRSKNIDPVTRQKLTDYHLDHYIFYGSEFTDLILLDNSVRKYNIDKSNDKELVESKFFYNCNIIPPKPFTSLEREYIKYANPKFHKFLLVTISDDIVKQSISLSTIDVLSQLVDRTLFPEGLSLVGAISDDKKAIIDEVYDKFKLYYDIMPEDEKQRLNNQIIIYKGKITSFKSIYRQILNNQCIADLSRYLLQLIIDYCPERQFREELEKGVVIKFQDVELHASVDISLMRERSRRLTLHDNDKFEHYSQILLLSMMTYSYETSWFNNNSHKISILDCSNYVNSSVKSIYDKLVYMMKNKNYTRYPDEIYSSINSAYVDQSLAKKTKDWIFSVISRDVFEKNCRIYEPEQIIHVLESLARKNYSLQLMLNTFLDDLLFVYVNRHEQEFLNKVLINIKLVNLLKTLENKDQNIILNRLKEENKDITFKKVCLDFIEYRMNLIIQEDVHSNLSWTASFFSSPTSKLKKSNSCEEDKSAVLSIEEKITFLVNTVDSWITKTTNNSKLPLIVKDKLLDYLNKLAGTSQLSTSPAGSSMIWFSRPVSRPGSGSFK